MLCRLRTWYYSLFILKVKFISKTITKDFTKLPVFSFIELTTNDGKNIIFTFKMDNTSKKSFYCAKYIVEAEVDDSFSPEIKRLNNKVLISMTIFLIRYHYKTFANILLHKYLEHAHEYLKQNSTK